MDALLSTHLLELRARAQDVADRCAAPRADEVDARALWPRHSMEALAETGLMGLHVPRRLGGHEQGLLGLVTVTEALGRACASSAMCYGMHCVATAVITAKATCAHEDAYLRPIAAGEHISSLALSESASGAHFYFPQTTLERDGDGFVVSGAKQFVTSGGYADSYVVSTTASGEGAQAGEFSCLVVDKDTPGLSWEGKWDGLGMRGNASRIMHLAQVRLAKGKLLGDEGDEIWYVFEVVAPYFLTAMAATYLGVAQAALDVSLQHLRGRRYGFSGERLAQVPILQHKLAELWVVVEKSRLLLYRAAQLGDHGDPRALATILSCKADMADTVVAVTNGAMTLCGGSAYRENSQLARLLRDARASHVMAPTTDILKTWTGRALLGLPLL